MLGFDVMRLIRVAFVLGVAFLAAPACSSTHACADGPDCPAPYGVKCPLEAPIDGTECKLVRGGEQSGCNYTLDGGTALAQCICTTLSYKTDPCPAAWSYTGGCPAAPPVAGSACTYQNKACPYPQDNAQAVCGCTQKDGICSWDWRIYELCSELPDGATCDAG